jgi:acetoin utilization protein AcuB
MKRTQNPNVTGIIRPNNTDIIRENGGRMRSVLTSYDDAPEGFLKIYLRMHGLERNRLKTLKQKIRGKATILYMIDHRENIREIYFDTDCKRPGFDTI